MQFFVFFHLKNGSVFSVLPAFIKSIKFIFFDWKRKKERTLHF